MTNSKPFNRTIRTDIQCLRALAIFGVLGFHLWPQVFPLGYLGVDVFFVISGYLMTSILTRSTSNGGFTFAVLLDFYNRRAKRILPPYILAIFGTIFTCQFVLTWSDLIDLKEDTIWALGIGTNVKTIWKKQQYFDNAHLYKFFLHTWSLGVEMQYYVFAPLILWVVAKFPLPLLLISLISAISWGSQCLITDKAVSFGFVGCRLWQFMIGTAAFYITRPPDNGYTLLVDAESQSETPQDANSVWKRLWYTLTVFSLSLLVFLPFISRPIVKDTAIASRLIASLLTGIMITFGAEAITISPIPSPILKALHYVGDISYSVYLVHWPLVIMSKYLDIFTSHYMFVLLVVIFALGMLQYTLFEKPLSKQPAKHINAIILLLYVACIAILYNQNTIHAMLGNPENYLTLNENLFAQCKQEFKAQQNCKQPNMLWLKSENRKFVQFMCEYNGTGSLTVLMAGNSYAMYMAQSLADAGKHKFKKLIVATASTCVIHKNMTHDKRFCRDVADNLHRTLAEVKPDIVIINERLWGTKILKTPPIDPQNDPLVNAMREDWAMISNYTKKLIIVEPAGGLLDSQDLLKPIRLNAPDLSLYARPLKDYKAEVDPGWDRVLKSVNSCPKCKLVGIRNYFCGPTSCDVYDTERRVSLYCDAAHHAATAIKRYMPSIVRELEICSNLVCL
uniref:Acyltransferase n=1 Tax=Panagrellus redivivus TaxID=6233 RepID=A0A7E4W306_PANRE